MLPAKQLSLTTKKVWLPYRQTDGQTDAGQNYPYVPLYFAGDTKVGLAFCPPLYLHQLSCSYMLEYLIQNRHCYRLTKKSSKQNESECFATQRFKHNYTMNTLYCRPSFVRSVLISRFIFWVLIHSVLHSWETCFYTWYMCKISPTDMFVAFYIRDFIVLANFAKIKCSRIKDGLQYMISSYSPWSLVPFDFDKSPKAFTRCQLQINEQYVTQDFFKTLMPLPIHIWIGLTFDLYFCTTNLNINRESLLIRDYLLIPSLKLLRQSILSYQLHKVLVTDLPIYLLTCAYAPPFSKGVKNKWRSKPRSQCHWLLFHLNGHH